MMSKLPYIHREVHGEDAALKMMNGYGAVNAAICLYACALFFLDAASVVMAVQISVVNELFLSSALSKNNRKKQP